MDKKTQNNIQKEKHLLNAIRVVLKKEGHLREDEDYIKTVKSLLDNQHVLKMAEHMHHDTSTLAHSIAVSKVSFYLAKKLKLDYKSTARGALLHDLYLYNWRDKVQKKHATEHPKIALRNAKKYFKINKIEEDIIEKHMWPLTLKPFKYKEAFLVSAVDKVVSAKEVFKMIQIIVFKKIKKLLAI